MVFDKAQSLMPQDHARMKDLKILVLMVARKPLYDPWRPISLQQFVFLSRVRFIVFGLFVPPKRWANHEHLLNYQ